MQTRTRNGTRLPVNARYGYKKGKDGRLEVDPEPAKVVKMIFKMAAEGTIFVTIFVTNFVTFKRNVMNKDGTKRRMKTPEKPVNTRKNALEKT